jgi:hypothetical protein
MKTIVRRSLFSAAVVAAFVCSNSTPAFSQSPADGPAAAVDSPAGGRFEGYTFRDASGQPLPFQTDEAIEAFLATAEVASMSKIPVGVTDPKKLLLEGEGLQVNAVFKDINREERNIRDTPGGKSKFYLHWRDWYGYDIAAYRLDRLLHLNRVPPVVERTIKRDTGSVQIWLQGVITDTKRRDEGYDPPNIGRYYQQKDIMHIFDNLVANRDSNLGNTLIDSNWRLWFIDCSRCFGDLTDLLYPDAITHCERGLFEGLKSLNEADLKEQLSPYLSDVEIKALLVRRDKIVARIEALFDQWDEVTILFDTIPADEVAPWAHD